MPAGAQQISSPQNPRVKRVVRLSNRRQRDEWKLTVVEGVREAARALDAGIAPLEAYLCPELIAGAEASELAGRLESLAGRLQGPGQAKEPAHSGFSLFEVTPAVFDKMAVRQASGGVLLIIPYLQLDLEKLPPGESPLIVVVDGAEKPGNLGAILRTADAAGVDGLIVTSEGEAGTDLHNPNTIRASLGAIFSLPLAQASFEQAAGWLRAKGISIVATTPQASTLYTDIAMSEPTAIVVGSEATGLGRGWLEAADHRVRIPMFGSVDSLNVSISAALLLYEAVRQRGKRGTWREGRLGQ
jgi:TrmH family RNA methyltransferase